MPGLVPGIHVLKV